MPLFALDQLRNARIDQRLEPLLEEVREHVATSPFPPKLGEQEEILAAYDGSRARYNVIASILGTKGNGADISTGLGFLPPILHRRGLDIVATERDVDTLDFAHRQHIEVRRYSIGVDSPPFAPESLDFVVLAEVLEHLRAAPVGVLRELAGILRPGGRLLLTTPNVARRSNIEALLAGENFLEPFPADLETSVDAREYIEHVREYSVGEVVDAVEDIGLVVEQMLTVGWDEAGYNPPANPWINDLIVAVARKAD